MNANPAPVAMTAAEILLDHLRLEGVTHLFGVPGAGIAFLLRRLRQRTDFKYIVCRHETGAAFMADGFFRATQIPGVVLVTSGPGATNALTGTMNADFGGSAVLTITGEVAQPYLGRGYLQEGTDCGLNVRDIYAAATHYSVEIDSADGVVHLTQQALRSMLSIPRRAARIGIPNNVAADIPSTPAVMATDTKAYRALPMAAPEEGVVRVLQVLLKAKRPVIMLGAGCREAFRCKETARAFRLLVEWLQIPVMTTSDGKGMFPETHDLSLGAYGFAGSQWPQYWLRTADGGQAHDALVVIGSSLGELATNCWNTMLLPNGPFLQVDINPGIIGRGFPVTEGIIAEAGALMRRLWEMASGVARDEQAVLARRDAVATLKAGNPRFVSATDYLSTGSPLQPAALCRILNELLPDEAMIFCDSGNCVGWGLHYLVIREKQEWHSALAMGTMGFGVCASIGARLGNPNRLCVALVGDGAVLMHAGEISTASANGIGVIWIVLADNNLNMVAQGMSHVFPSDENYKETYRLGSNDLVKMAQALGADAVEISTPADLLASWQHIKAGAEAGRPQMVVARIAADAAPPYWDPPYWPVQPHR